VSMDSESATLNAAQRSVGDRTARLAAAPIVLDAEGITKTFWIPDQRIDSFKERAVHPLRRQHFRRLGQINIRNPEADAITDPNRTLCRHVRWVVPGAASQTALLAHAVGRASQRV